MIVEFFAPALCADHFGSAPTSAARTRREVIHANEIVLERDGQRIGLRREDLAAQSLGLVNDFVVRAIQVAVKPQRDRVRHELFAAGAARSAPQCDPPVLFIQGLPPHRVDGVAAATGAALEAFFGTNSAGAACEQRAKPGKHGASTTAGPPQALRVEGLRASPGLVARHD
jgi:hypothetical protein